MTIHLVTVATSDLEAVPASVSVRVETPKPLNPKRCPLCGGIYDSGSLESEPGISSLAEASSELSETRSRVYRI